MSRTETSPHQQSWLRPDATTAAEPAAEPRWGHPDGIQVGLHPLPGPRGLLRIFAPYLGHPRDRLLNFIALEPIPQGETARGYSELEHSALDDAPGKRFWSADDLSDIAPRDPLSPAQGVVELVDGVETLTVHILSERFDNGAEVAVRVRFRSDRPHELALATLALPGSAPLEYLVVTATMGNYARLRRLALADATVTPAELWPGFTGAHFAEHAEFALDRLPRNAAGEVEVSATTDEADPEAAVYDSDVAEHWKYSGLRAVQTWIAADPDPRLRVLVNARAAYWASTATIPGGPSFENFEFVEPFRQGREFRFRIEPVA
ncbi:hypothetical protein AB4Z18_04130 [Leifsonia sp. 2TAF2]|uniref:hypothetical protein n=1 Tax=Leifsonia sp. 2TAF2 TaxID=3233009 RepID=UPI003F9D4288